jgi:putative ABC transport system ATP-binding protein
MSKAIYVEDMAYQWPRTLQPTLRIAHWQVEAGQRIFLYGPSGSGKTTLMNLLAGILVPGQGRVEVLGQSLGALRARRRDHFRARNIGYIFQQFNLVPYLSVADNIALASHFGAPGWFRPHGSRASLRRKTSDLMARLGIGLDLLARQARTLSVGQQQRVAVVRALINQPRVIIADEPSSALDTDSRDEFLELLLECAAHSGSTVIFVSHDRSVAHHFDVSVALTSLNCTAGGG